jgi:hypothetical protein
MKALMTLMTLSLSMAAVASTNHYLTLLDTFEKETNYLKRKKIVNDNYECIKVTENGNSNKYEQILRLKKSGREDVLVTFPNTQWDKKILSKTDSSSYGTEGFQVKRIAFGELLIKVEAAILDCKYPESDDDFWDL